MEYSFISPKFLSDWMEDDYSGIVLRAKSNKTPFMMACGCGKTILTANSKSTKKCPHCNGKLLYVPIKRNDVSRMTISIYEKVKPVTDAGGNIHIQDSHLILKGNIGANTTELYLEEINRPLYMYNPATDTFSKDSSSFSSRVSHMYSYSDMKSQTFMEVIESLGSYSGNIVMKLLEKNFYHLSDSFDKFTKVVADYPKLFTEDNIEKYFKFFVTLLRVFANSVAPSSSLRPLAALTATSTMDDVFNLLNITEKARPYLNQMNFTEWGNNDRSKMFNDLVKNKIPYSSYFMDLFNRDVISAAILDGIYQTYKTILKKGEINVRVKVIRGESNTINKTVVLPTKMADVFLDFCKKFINYQIDFTNTFMERYLNLDSLGILPTLDEMLNRAYFKRINQERFTYNGKENFDDLFKQDPLEAIKHMK